jgi:hypothetical protein
MEFSREVSHSFNHFMKADVHTSEVDAKPASVRLGLIGFGFGKYCWATEESTAVKQWVSLLKPIVKQPTVPTAEQQ